MGAHTRFTSSHTPSCSPGAGRAAAATGLTVLGLLGSTGAALADDTTSPTGPTQDSIRDSDCSVGGTPAGGTGTGSPDGVITNGQCSPDEIEQAQHDADADGDPNTRGSFDSDAHDEDTAAGDPTVVGGSGDGISSQSGTAQKVEHPGEDPEPALADVL